MRSVFDAINILCKFHQIVIFSVDLKIFRRDSIWKYCEQLIQECSIGNFFCFSHIVKEAVEKHGISAILNSDQDCQFNGSEFKALLKKYYIRQNLDGMSRWVDNIMIERWFRSLKNEWVYLNEYHLPCELCKR